MSSVTVYSSPFCGYCSAAKKLLRAKDVRFTEIDVLFAPSRRTEMLQRSGRRTVPQVFFGDRHIGGFDDLQALEDRGELDALIAELTGGS